jgi:hypothetical protein
MSNGQEIKVNSPPELHGGVYSNNMVVSHTKEEFVLDFIMVAPLAGAVTARVIVSPGHMKRILAALQDNIAKYEKNFGTIQVAEANTDGELQDLRCWITRRGDPEMG